jgi:DNA-binding transcriptional LysR family regulator
MEDILFSKSGLSLDRLKSFCLVAEAESFTKAAGGDSNRQTQFSRQIKDLEQFFGTELFQRKGRTVTLSTTGMELHTLVSEYFCALEDFHERCSGELGIGSLDFALFLPKKAARKATDEAALLSLLPLATMEGDGSYQSFLDQLPAKHGIILRKSVSCSSFPMMAKTLKVLGFAAILPKIAREELASSAFEMRTLESLQELTRELCLCWNKRRATMNPIIQKFGYSFSDLLKG